MFGTDNNTTIKKSHTVPLFLKYKHGHRYIPRKNFRSLRGKRKKIRELGSPVSIRRQEPHANQDIYNDLAGCIEGLHPGHHVDMKKIQNKRNKVDKGRQCRNVH